MDVFNGGCMQFRLFLTITVTNVAKNGFVHDLDKGTEEIMDKAEILNFLIY